jgi:sphingosine kinase
MKFHSDSRTTNAPIVGSGSSLNIPVYNILWVEVLESRLEIIYASSSNEDVQPTSLRYRVDVDLESINKWVSLLLHHAYRDSQRRRRAKVLINPVSGRGLARGLFSEHIEPILKAARWVTEVVETKGKGDGEKILLEMDITSFDLVVVCSGDGLAHEVFNGLGKRSDATLALSRMPIAHLPCGSGNGLSYNLNQTKNVSKATLSMIKSVTRPLDLISITQGDRRSLSFLSQGAGSAAESDIATEPLRWMGEIRFALGFLWCIAAKKTYPADFAVKIAVESNSAILQHDEEYYAMDNGVDGKSGSGAGSETYPAGDLKVQHGLPLLKYGTINDKIPDDWTIISREDLGLFYCGNVRHSQSKHKHS